jgi:hypothetical protein
VAGEGTAAGREGQPTDGAGIGASGLVVGCFGPALPAESSLAIRRKQRPFGPRTLAWPNELS